MYELKQVLELRLSLYTVQVKKSTMMDGLTMMATFGSLTLAVLVIADMWQWGNLKTGNASQTLDLLNRSL